MKKFLLKNLFLLVFLNTASLRATTAFSDSLGLENRYALLPAQYPYIFENPATVFFFANHFIADYAAPDPSGGFILSQENLSVGLFSGTPSEGALNSAAPQGGLFHLAKPTYQPQVETGSGMTLDAAATNSAYYLGNLQSRVSRLDDAGDLPLRKQNLSLILAFGQSSAGLAFLWDFGRVSDQEEHEGFGKEKISLMRQQMSLGLGFISAPSDSLPLFDGYLKVKVYDIKNEFAATGSGGETIQASYRTSGSFSTESNLRIGIRLSSVVYSYFLGGLSFFDHSTTANARAHAGSLSPFHFQDTYSRTGYRYEIGFSLRRDFAQNSFAYLAMLWEAFNIDLFYDGIDHTNSQYSSEPYGAHLSYQRLPLIAGFSTRLNQTWLLNFSLRSFLYREPAEGFVFAQERWIRQNPAFKDREFQESHRTVLQNPLATQVNMGFSCQIAEVRFDWLASIELLRRGPHFISGTQIPLLTRLGISYNFASWFKENKEKKED
ncbi:MAG: hypothetical protein NZM25_11120 [Leptospiraceae bacterium]|nr:hypothetical protein [Leptospiraceae bacterium]MDW8305979.1 hypothetical protein [Leptospiraceae bacterium]